MGPHPAVAEVRRAVRAALEQTDGPLLVACSGGADSLALAAATAFEASRAGRTAGLITVDHGLQTGSAEQARAVAQLGYELGFDPVEIVPVAVGSSGGPEAAARTARYAALQAAASALGAHVLLGHTLDDQAETVLLGLGRGSGPRSIAGMHAHNGSWLRPLLGVRRSVTAAACEALGLQPWDDPHNADPAYQRVRLRTEVLPLLEDVLQGGVAEALARTATQLQDDLAALAMITPESPLHGGASRDHRGAGLDVAPLAGLPAAVRTRVLRRWAGEVGAGALTSVHIDALDALVTDWHGQGAVDLPGGVRVRRASARLVRVSELDADIEAVVVTADEIKDKIAELAKEIDSDYAGREPLLVGVLKGAAMFMSDLARALERPSTMEFMAVSSYGSSTTSSGVVRILKDLDRDIAGQHVLIVEDIIDSGLTLSWLLKNLASRQPASVEVVALLRKPDAVKVDVPVKYVGFDIPNDFVVGYGLDYAEKYRDLPYIGRLKPAVYGG